MMQHQFTSLADQAAERYGALVDAWRGVYAQALDNRKFGTPANIDEAVGQAYEIARRFLDGEDQRIEDAFDGIVSEALQTTLRELSATRAQEIPDAVSEHVDALGRYLHSELAIQIERDIAHLRASLLRAQLQVAVAARATSLPMRAALISYRMSDTEKLQFFFHDRRNQKWPSRRFVRALWRHNLMALYNETVLILLADHGETFALVRHVNPDADAHGMQIALAANTDTPIYTDIRNEIFHPNSDAILARWLPLED